MALKIKGKAILIGYNPAGVCVYSEVVDIHDYYDGDHVWDSAEGIQRLQLQRVAGFLFSSSGVLDQEFESIFNLDTGIFQSGSVRRSDGTTRLFPPATSS